MAGDGRSGAMRAMYWLYSALSVEMATQLAWLPDRQGDPNQYAGSDPDGPCLVQHSSAQSIGDIKSSSG